MIELLQGSSLGPLLFNVIEKVQIMSFFSRYHHEGQFNVNVHEQLFKFGPFMILNSRGSKFGPFFLDLFMILNSRGSKLEQRFMLIRWTFMIISREKVGTFVDLFMILNSRGSQFGPFFLDLFYDIE